MKRKKTARKYLIWGGGSIIVLYFLFGAEYNFYNLWKLHTKKKQLMEKIDHSEQRKQELLSRIERLKNDSTYIEKLARENYKMGKKGEKVYIFNTKDDE